MITDPEVDAAPHSSGSEIVEPCVRYEELIQVRPLVVNVCGNALQCDEALEPIETVLAARWINCLRKQPRYIGARESFAG